VFFFPKRELGRRGTPFEFASPVLRTLPELSAVEPDSAPYDEPVTEPTFVTPFSAEPNVSHRRGPSSRRRRGRTRETALPVEPEREDAAITEEFVAPDEAAAQETAPVSPYAGLSKRELAEVSVFGHGLFEEGRIDEARQVFEQLVAAGVEDAFPHTMLGTIYLAAREPDRALALFEAALALDPKDLAARVYRGEIRLHRGSLKQAVADLEQAYREGPEGDPFTERARRLLRKAADGTKRRR
jgi:pentatricopeptide repeat protein